MSTEHDISVLNSLIATTLDSVHGFRDAADDSEVGTYQSLFIQFAGDREQVATRLQSEVSRQGGMPEDDGTFLAAAHRGFMNLREVVSSRDDRAIIEEVERGEDYIKGKYEDALRDDELSAPTRAAIEQAYGSVRSGHDHVSALKHRALG